MKITTTHTEIGYSHNVEIVATALREKFGFDDQSHMLTAVAAHVWSTICGKGDVKEWGTKEVSEALAACEARLTRMKAKLDPEHPLSQDEPNQFRIHYEKEGVVARALVGAGLGWLSDNGNVFNSRDTVAMEIFENAMVERDTDPNKVRRFVRTVY